MTNQQILDKAITKAIENGWDEGELSNGWGSWNDGDQGATIREGEILRYDSDGYWTEYPFERVIFNHDFAKALWGEEDNWSTTKCTCGGEIHPLMDLHDTDCAKVRADRGYKFHLQQMVISSDRIEYLGQNIDL